MISHNQLLCNQWYKNAEIYPDKDAIVHWVAGEEPYRWSFSGLIKSAEIFAIKLKEMGIQRNDVCAIIMRHNKNFYPLYLSISLLGAIPAVLAYPNPRLHPIKFRQGIEGMSKHSGLDYIITENDLESVLKPLLVEKGSTIKGLLFPFDVNTKFAYKPEEIDNICAQRVNLLPYETAVLQHSSGTTGLQKPVALSHQAILQHIDYYGNALKLNNSDKIINWLPLYHDMGLIAAFHMPLLFGITTVQLNTFEWVIASSLLCEAISKEKGTLVWMPNFAFNMMAGKVLDADLDGLKLDSLRMIINCSEPIRHESHNKFYNKFIPYGLKSNTISSCYAMAETTFAVTQSDPGSNPVVLKVDGKKLSKGIIKIIDDSSKARICVSSGKTIEGCQIKIVDDSRNELPDGIVGEISISSVSMFNGYRNYPEKTSEVLENGWYYSGDYGFKYKEECFVIGRKKDIIIVGGNNIYPEDIEDIVSDVEGVIPGRVIAFGEFDEEIGSEQVSIIAETENSDIEYQKYLRLKIIIAAMATDVTIKKIYLVPPRWMIKSSAGKPSRKNNKERILNEEYL